MLCSWTISKLLSQMARLEIYTSSLKLFRLMEKERKIIPNIFFNTGVLFVECGFPQLPVLIKISIDGECAGEGECEHGENRERLHLNVHIRVIISRVFLSECTYLRCVKQKVNAFCCGFFTGFYSVK